MLAFTQSWQVKQAKMKEEEERELSDDNAHFMQYCFSLNAFVDQRSELKPLAHKAKRDHYRETDGVVRMKAKRKSKKKKNISNKTQHMKSS